MAFSGPGGVAQLGERLNGIQEVRGSIPLASIGYVLRLVTWEKSLVAVSSSWLLLSCLPAFAGIAQLVEHNLAKVGVAGSSPVSRSHETSDGGRETRGSDLLSSSPVRSHPSDFLGG